MADIVLSGRSGWFSARPPASAVRDTHNTSLAISIVDTFDVVSAHSTSFSAKRLLAERGLVGSSAKLDLSEAAIEPFVCEDCIVVNCVVVCLDAATESAGAESANAILLIQR